MTSGGEAFLRRFHAEHPGITARAFGRGGSYQRLAARVPAGARVLDLAGGDGVLAALLAAAGAHPVGFDISAEELSRRAPGVPAVRGRAQALPFADRSFDAVVCHLAFMLFDDLDAVVDELARVLAPGGDFAAVLGGGPVADGDDAFHRFLHLAAPQLHAAPRFGDPRAGSEAGWRALFAAHIGEPRAWAEIAFERWPIDLGGSFAEVWDFLGASYQLADADRAALGAMLRAATADLADADGRIPCRVAMYLGTVRRAS